MRLLRCILICIFLACAFLALILQGTNDFPPSPPSAARVILNQYAPADWNSWYGHWDLTLEIPSSMPQLTLEEIPVDCREITISHGPTQGDRSRARLDLYPGGRSDVCPSSRYTMFENLPQKSLEAFLAWLNRDFSSFRAYDADRNSFSYDVTDPDFRIYSLPKQKNCLTAAQCLIDHISKINAAA